MHHHSYVLAGTARGCPATGNLRAQHNAAMFPKCWAVQVMGKFKLFHDSDTRTAHLLLANLVASRSGELSQEALRLTVTYFSWSSASLSFQRDLLPVRWVSESSKGVIEMDQATTSIPLIIRGTCGPVSVVKSWVSNGVNEEAIGFRKKTDS